MTAKTQSPLARLGSLARKCRELGVTRCRVRYPDGTELELELGEAVAKPAKAPKVTKLQEAREKQKREETAKKAEERRRRAVFGATGFVPVKR